MYSLAVSCLKPFNLHDNIFDSVLNETVLNVYVLSAHSQLQVSNATIYIATRTVYLATTSTCIMFTQEYIQHASYVNESADDGTVRISFML